MPRPEKVQAVADIKERLEAAQAVFLAEYSGLSVSQQQTLRRALKEQEAEFKVVKMTLARRAAAELDITDLDDLLLGPTGLAYADGDPVGAAKVLSDFAKEHETFLVKGGLYSGEVLTPERVSELADIEPREVLLAKIAGLFSAPASNVAGLLQGLQQEVAGLIQALADRKEELGEPEPATAAEEPAPEAAAAEPAEDAAPESEDTTDSEEATATADASEDSAAETGDDGAEEATEEAAAADEPETADTAEADETTDEENEAEASTDAEPAAEADESTADAAEADADDAAEADDDDAASDDDEPAADKET